MIVHRAVVRNQAYISQAKTALRSKRGPQTPKRAGTFLGATGLRRRPLANNGKVRRERRREVNTGVDEMLPALGTLVSD